MLGLPPPTRMAAISALLCAGGSVAAATRMAGNVDARDTAVHNVWAGAGESLVEVVGSGATDLDCYVYDRSGSLRGFDNGVTDRCRIVFHQRSSGNIHVEIENLGNVANRYRLEIDARAPRFSGR
jgi:hypothetical protein